MPAPADMDSTIPQDNRMILDPAKKSKKVLFQKTSADDNAISTDATTKPKNSANNNGRPRNEGTAGGKENRPLPNTKPKEYVRNPVSDHGEFCVYTGTDKLIVIWPLAIVARPAHSSRCSGNRGPAKLSTSRWARMWLID